MSEVPAWFARALGKARVQDRMNAQPVRISPFQVCVLASLSTRDAELALAARRGERIDEPFPSGWVTPAEVVDSLIDVGLVAELDTIAEEFRVLEVLGLIERNGTRNDGKVGSIVEAIKLSPLGMALIYGLPRYWRTHA